MTNHEDQGLDYAEMIEAMVVNTWEVDEKIVIINDKAVIATLFCIVVHNHAIITYKIMVDVREVGQYSDYAEAIKDFNAL